MNGLQGCSRPECSFSGFYLCPYSPEGFCEECEIKYYPDRFNGCMFCRRPVEHYKCCDECGDGFKFWVKKNTNIKIDHACHRLTSGEYKEFTFIPNEEMLEYEWPGFYIGDSKWTKDVPNLPLQTLEEVNWNNCDSVLRGLLESNGIYVDQEIQFKSVDQK